MHSMARQPRPRALLLAVCLLLTGAAVPASAQQSVTDVLTFLLTNRSIPTGDFVRDEQAAVETRDVLARFLSLELATIPVSSSAGGFTYRLDPALGMAVRSSDSFGPFFTERSLTTGRHQASFGIGYGSTSFDNIDGREPAGRHAGLDGERPARRPGAIRHRNRGAANPHRHDDA